jgi:pantetheine-phosphate adenylyltransferase
MVDANFIEQHLSSLGFKPSVLENYSESHRYYHTLKHLIEVIDHLKLQDQFDKELFLAAVYHDAVYNPKSDDNEEQSAKLF